MVVVLMIMGSRDGGGRGACPCKGSAFVVLYWCLWWVGGISGCGVVKCCDEWWA